MADINNQEAGAKKSARHHVLNEKTARFNQVLCDDVVGLQEALWQTFAEHQVFEALHTRQTRDWQDDGVEHQEEIVPSHICYMLVRLQLVV